MNITTPAEARALVHEPEPTLLPSPPGSDLDGLMLCVHCGEIYAFRHPGNVATVPRDYKVKPCAVRVLESWGML